MDFSKFEKVENTFDRKGGYTLVKEQEYEDLKYRKAVKKSKDAEGKEVETIEGRFYISNARFDSMGLATNGLRQFTAPDGDTILGVVSAADAAILKASKKSKNGNKVKNFKSPKLEAALANMGVIDSNLVGENQFIKLNSVATAVSVKGISCIEVFTFSKGTAKPKTEKEEVVADVKNTPVSPVAQDVAEPVANAAAEDWN